ncbi:MAG: LamG-like jellyroll fold domain-containing protein, partial [Mariniblastus sp.]
MFKPVLKFFCVFVTCLSSYSTAHEGPDPIAHWVLNERSVVDGQTLESRLGPSAKIDGSVSQSGTGLASSLHFDGDAIAIVQADHTKLAANLLPKKDITIATWFSIEEEKEWGGIVGVVQDNGAQEKGWVVGYNQRRFYFGLATVGADDGNGKMTYLESETRDEKGKLYHALATYDGKKRQQMVNGELA